MKKIILTIFILFAFSINAQQLNGVYVLSEGGFSAGTSMLSKLNTSSNEFTQSFFTPGLYPDGLLISDDNIFVVEQGSYGGAGKVSKLDKAGNFLASKEVGINPFSLAIANDKIYLTNGPARNVSVITQNDLSDVTEIAVGVYPQEIISYDGKVFVANNSLWGGDSDSTVSVIDSETDEVVNTITVKLNPSALAINNDGNLLIGCPTGMIYEVELTSFTKVDSFEVTEVGFGNDIWVDKNSDMIYFKSSTNAVVGLNLSTKESEITVNDTSLVYAYGYGYDYVSGNHYLADAKDFASNGSLTVYNREGEFLNTYETSISPRRIAFDYDNSAVSVKDKIIATDFRLEQNYPNPFNPTTKIQYSVPANVKGEKANVKLVVFDVLGKEVAALVNEEKTTGVYEVNFDASRLASGIYYYTLKVGNFIQTRKMMLIK